MYEQYKFYSFVYNKDVLYYDILKLNSEYKFDSFIKSRGRMTSGVVSPRVTDWCSE